MYLLYYLQSWDELSLPILFRAVYGDMLRVDLMVLVNKGMVGPIQRRNKHVDDEVKVKVDDDHNVGLDAYQNCNWSGDGCCTMGVVCEDDMAVVDE
jgi:hypothetical protein